MAKALAGGVLFALLALSGLSGLSGPAAAAAAPAGSVAVTLDQSRHDTVLGDRITFVSHLTNRDETPTGELVAHLDVTSLTSEVYVDPEDWSAERTVELSPLAGGDSVDLPWRLQAVNAGSFALYVVVLPKDPAALGRDRLVVSSPLQIEVTGRRTLDVGGALPVVVATPVVLGVLMIATRRRLRGRG